MRDERNSFRSKLLSLALSVFLLAFLGLTPVSTDEMLSKDDSLTNSPDFGADELDPDLIPEESETGGGSNNRSKKALRNMLNDERDSMLFEVGGKMEDPAKLDTTDLIFRLQEKYEYRLCELYKTSVDSKHYFQFEGDLVEPFRGDRQERELKKQRRSKTFNSRYRLYGEECDPKSEKEFWLKMFMVAEQDFVPCKVQPKRVMDLMPVLKKNGRKRRRVKRQKPPTPTPATPVYSTTTPEPLSNNLISKRKDKTKPKNCRLKYQPKEIMGKWDEVWESFKTKGVCNQHLLLECLPDEQEPSPTGGGHIHKCLCRRNGIGLPTVINMSSVIHSGNHIQHEFYTTQYYYGNPKLEKDNVKYDEMLKCVARANLPKSGWDVPFINPCDFFLPMVGLCTVPCVKNASCTSVNLNEKTEWRNQKESSEDIRVRVTSQKLHETYHNKCLCQKGKVCRKLLHEEFNLAMKIKPGRWYLIFTTALLKFFIG